MSGPLPSMFDIPELFNMVLSLLSKQDLARCVQVNKQWRDAANTYLWRAFLPISVHHLKVFQRTVMEDYLQAQEHQQELLRTKDVKQHQRQKAPSCQSSLSKYGPLVRNLDNPHFLFYKLKGTTQKVLLSHFLKYCVIVEVLTLDVNLAQCRDYHPLFKLVVDSLAPNLRELCLRGSRHKSSFGMSSRWYLYVISLCSFRLEKLTIYNDADGDFVDDIKSVKLPIADAKLSGLKELVLDHCWIKEELSSWNWVWKSCSNVERLELRTCGYDHIDDMAARIRTYLPAVNSLVYKGDIFIVVPASLLSACLGGWKNIRIDAMLDRSSCKALAEHCATLEVLQVTNILEDSSSTLCQILSSSPNLRILITSDDKLHIQQWIPYLEAEDFVDAHCGTLNPWACETSVKVLKTKITRIPRPNVTKLLNGLQRADALKETCTREGKQLQQCVYERLSRFINLEELCLGLDSKERRRLYPFDSSKYGEDYQYECLEMTLESGLDQLKGLKNLRVLDVRMMEQRIGLKEVQWMTQYWPRLREIRGLWDDGDNLKAGEWLWKHSPMIKVELTSRSFYCATFLDELLKERI